MKKEEAGADASSSTDADGDATMNGEEAEVKGEEAEEKGPKKVKMAPIVAEIDQIEVSHKRLAMCFKRLICSDFVALCENQTGDPVDQNFTEDPF